MPTQTFMIPNPMHGRWRMVCQGCGVRSRSYPDLDSCDEACAEEGWLALIPRRAHFCPTCGDEIDEDVQLSIARSYVLRFDGLRQASRQVGQLIAQAFVEGT